jgi:hypothetical protein
LLLADQLFKMAKLFVAPVTLFRQVTEGETFTLDEPSLISLM